METVQQPRPARNGERATAHASTRWSARHVQVLGVGLCVFAGLVLVVVGERGQGLAHATAAPWACLLSGIALLAVHRERWRLRRTTLRALADLALLSPIPLAVAMVLLARHA